MTDATDPPASAVWEALAAHCAGRPEAEVEAIIRAACEPLAGGVAEDVTPDLVVGG